MNIDPALKDIATLHDHVYWIGAIPWLRAGAMLEPLAMPHAVGQVDRDALADTLARSGAWLARWTDQWDSPQGEWWWTCCDNPEYDVETIESSRGRRGIRKGQRQCTVRRLEPAEFAELGHPIHARAQRDYGVDASKVTTAEAFRANILRCTGLQGPEIWGAFVDGQLAAFSNCRVANGAVNLGSTKSDPDAHAHCPNNALFYEITRHYLRDRGMKYVTNGSRTLHHPTDINAFLIRMGYRRIYCRLNVALSRSAGWIHRARVSRWGPWLGLPRLAPGRWRGIAAFGELVAIAESFKA